VVLDVGIGSGLTIPLYGRAVQRLYGIDPSLALLRMARGRAAGGSCPIMLIEGMAEQLPLAEGTVDTVVTTWTLCSIADPERALREIRRVLHPEGTLLFLEHGRAPEPRVRRWQQWLTPLWRRVSGGCHLDRPIDHLVRQGGFAITALEGRYAAGPKVLTYWYRGVARPTDHTGCQSPPVPAAPRGASCRPCHSESQAKEECHHA
jgi:SAM-dependent methyltransferase